MEELSAWADWMSVRGMARTTIESYEWWVMRFMMRASRQMGYPVLLDTATEREIVAYLAALPANGHSRGMSLRALKSYYKWAIRAKLVAEDPTSELRIPRGRYTPAPTLSPEDVYRLFLCAWERHPRRAWAILLLYTTGGRREAICHLRPEDVKDGWVTFLVAKGGRSYRVPASQYSEVAISHLLSDPLPVRGNTPSPWREFVVGVSPGRLSQWVEEAAKDAGVPAWPHLFRHAFATRLAQDVECDPRTWMSLLGHQDLSQYARYAHPLEGRMRNALERL
jgi:integrase/recombinase XerC